MTNVYMMDESETNPIQSNIHTGSSFDSFLEEEGLLEVVEAEAIKRVTDWQLSELYVAELQMEAEIEHLRAELEKMRAKNVRERIESSLHSREIHS